MVAAARAVASEQDNPVITDPFAAPLVRAVGLEFFTRLVDGGLPTDSVEHGFGVEIDSIAVRTRFFDEFFLDSARAGVRQAVILASGLDARGFRMPWPSGTVVYEIDQPKVLEFKRAALSALGATPSAQHRSVGIDLREDWPTALRRSGFDPGQATAWIAEGLLMYLPPDAQDRLLDNVTALSGPGSRFATEYHPDSGVSMLDRARQFNQRWADFGCDIDLSGLFYDGERSNVVDYLEGQGWQVRTRPRRDLFAEYGRTFPEDPGSAPLRNIVTVTATRE
ncbi:class I SAM-dependent methyltransferase [Mycobacterium sp.]|uniref:class I SAM-dependent methyltransferase n=1 Tax=Mycobacterium sp. TaxID=1785 RepID=UPI003A836C17